MDSPRGSFAAFCPPAPSVRTPAAPSPAPCRRGAWSASRVPASSWWARLPRSLERRLRGSAAAPSALQRGAVQLGARPAREIVEGLAALGGPESGLHRRFELGFVRPALREG